MRKIFTTLKSVVAAAVVASMTLAASCSYDDTALVERVDRVEKDLATLTERVAALEKRLGEEVEALTALINGKVVVTSVEKQGDATKVTLSDGSSFTVYPECTVVDTDTDTNTYISIAEDNGVLYFAVYEMGQFKEWLLVNGEKVPVYDGNDQDDNVCDDPYQPEAPVAPQFKVEGDQIMVSIDGGNTWVASGLSAAAAGAQIFTGVEVNTDNTVTFTLADGSSFNVVVAELIEFNTTRGQLYVKPGETIDITVTINDSVADVNVMNQPLGWKAEVAPKAADENGEGEGDDVDPGMGVMAAGGTEFTLKITAPSQDFIAAGYAEKSGYISVHFNSDNGACKVGKIAVDVAEITLDVDKEGMITITNTWVDKYVYSGWYGEENIEEFNNYYLAIMPLDYYNEDLSQIYNSSWWEFNVPCVAGYIQNFFANVNPEFNTYDKIQYVEGENEKWVFKATVKDIIDEIDYYGSVSYEGESFMVVVVPTNPQEGGVLMLDKAIAAPFRQLNVNVEVAESTWNDVFFNAKLRGAKAYHFNIKDKAELEREVNNGWYDSVDGYFEEYLNYWALYGSQFGSHTVTTDVVNQHISLNDLLNYTATQTYNISLAPNTTYYFALVAEIEGKTEYTVDDIIRFEFTTADLVEAETPFDVDVTLNEEETEYFEIAADVTVPENTAKVYSLWTDEEILEDIKDTVIANSYPVEDFAEGYSFTIYTSTEAENTTKYLTIVVVNEDGAYSIVQREFKSKAVVVKEGVTLAISNVEFLTSEGVANVTLSGVEGQEVASYRAYACTKGAYSYYVMEEAEIATLAYSNDWRIKEYKSNPFTITSTADYKNAAVMGNTYVIAVAVVFADGSVSNVVCEEHEFESTEPAVTVVSAAATREGVANENTRVNFTMSNGDVYAIDFRTIENNHEFLTVGSYTDSWTNFSSGWYDGFIGYAYKNGAYIGWADTTVAYENDAYNIMFRVTEDWSTFFEYTYVGAIEGLGAPKAKEDVPEGEVQVIEYELTRFNNPDNWGDFSVFGMANGEEVELMKLSVRPLAGKQFTTATYTLDDVDVYNTYFWFDGLQTQAGTCNGFKDITADFTAENGVISAATVTINIDNKSYVFTL